jgi:G3E family GTPase
MKVHLVGGFTGSGKSTAIENAKKLLKSKAIPATVISDKEDEYFLADCPNQQGFGDFGAPFAKVTGGCFCCNYTQLDQQINMVKKRSDQSVLFADYGGTCTNLISTLLKPLQDYKGAEIEVANFSTFVEARFLLLHLQGKRVPLSAESKYIWEKHLEEAELLVINKIDLISETDLEELKNLTEKNLSSKRFLFLNALEPESISNWVENIGRPATDGAEIKKEAENSSMAWLDEEIQIVTEDHSAGRVAYELMQTLSKDLTGRGIEIEHLKFLLYGEEQPLKLTHTQFLDGNLPVPESFKESGTADLLINARIHTSPDELRKLLFDILHQFKSKDGVQVIEKFISYFQ